MNEYKNILLIHKILTKEATLEEISYYNSWIKESHENVTLVNEIESIWTVSKSIDKENTSIDKNAAKAMLFSNIEGINQKTDTLVENSTLQSKVFNLKRAYAIAAVFVIAIGSIFFLNKFLNQSLSYSSNDTVSFYSLPDNSKIWLDKGSKLDLLNDFNKTNRKVILNGSAYFDVAENENIPFVIDILNNKIEVVGTSFMVYSVNGDRIGVNVYKGVVKLTTSDNESITLKKGEGAEVLTESKSIVKINSNDFRKEFRKEYLTFQNSPLKEVFFRLSNYFNIKIVDKCGQIETMKGFTSPQHAGDSETDFFKTIERLYDVKIEKSAYNIYTIKCD